MILQYITNASIMLLCVFCHYLVSLRIQGRTTEQAFYRPLLTGLFFGIVGVYLVWAAILVEGPVRMDLRSIAVLVAAMLGGPASALIAGIIITIGRLWQGGIHYVPMVGAVSTLLIALGNAWNIRKPSASRFKMWVAGYIFTYIVIFITYALVIEQLSTLANVMFYYTLVSLPTVWLCCQLDAQLIRVQDLYGEVHYNEEKYRLLFHNAHDLAYLFTVEDGKPGRYLEVNEAMVSVLGFTNKRELMQSVPENVFDPELLVFEMDTEGMCALKGQQHIYEWNLISRQGRIVPVEISGRVFRMRGELVCFAVARDITLRKESENRLLEANRKLEKLSISDGLTGIFNRRGMDLYFRMFWDQGIQYSRPLAILLLDIDCFKIYNDTYGHIAGDQCLKRIAGLLEQWANMEQGVAARYGGEEFIVVLPETNLEKALRVGIALRKGVEELAIPNSGSSVLKVVTVSMGVATCYPTENGMDRDELLKEADAALYMAKQTGRNRVMAWEQSEVAAARADDEAEGH